jgi:hypothetical protein
VDALNSPGVAEGGFTGVGLASGFLSAAVLLLLTSATIISNITQLVLSSA